MSATRVLNKVLAEYRLLRRYMNRTDCKPVGRQAYEMLQLFLQGSFTPEEYLCYGFGKKGADQRTRCRYLSNSVRLDVLQPVLNKSVNSRVLDDKFQFYSRYRDSPVPLADLYGIYKRDCGVDAWGSSLTNPSELRLLLLKARPDSLVVKPARGSGGRDILIIDSIRYGSDILFNTLANSTLTFDELTEHLETYRSKDFDQGFLLERKLSQHPFLQALNPYTINHFRIVTLLTFEDRPRILFASLKMGRRGSEIANTSRGGIAIHVDPVSGMMGKGRTRIEFGDEVFTLHPDSGAEFSGVRIPFWDEIVGAAKTAAALTPDFRIVGWDILYTPTGPVVIEANPRFGIMVPQAASEGYVDEELRGELLKFGLRLPTESDSTGIRLSSLREALRRWMRL